MARRCVPQASELVLQSNATAPVLPEVGNFFYTPEGFPGDTGDICVECGLNGALVTEVGTLQPCPEPEADPECVQVCFQGA